jgi:peptidoglycan/LPS O-acetylase OafA/YrhL
MPTPAGVFANAFYFQNILHITPISEVAWTLCLEIQFYLAFIGVLALGRAAVRGHWRPDRVPTFVWIAVGGFGIASLKWNLRPAIGTTWLGAYWCYFAVGVLICWALSHRMPRPVVDVVLAAMVAATIWRHSPQLIAGCATALAIYGVGLLGRLSTWFSARPLQWLGAISYSLYLVHLPILSVVMRGGYKLTHDNRVAALGWMFLAAALSLIAAYFFHRFIERPSMNLASSLSRNPQPAKVESATIEPPDVEMQAAL